MIEPEIAFCDLNGLMDIEEEMLKYVVNYVLEYRMLTKLYSTYIEGLKNNVLEDGKISEIGTHDELINKEGFYSNVWKLQQMIEEVC